MSHADDYGSIPGIPYRSRENYQEWFLSAELREPLSTAGSGSLNKKYICVILFNLG